MTLELLAIIVPVVLGYIAWNERDKKVMREKIQQKIDKDEAKELMDLKIAPVNVRSQEIKENLIKIETKINRILDKLSEK